MLLLVHPASAGHGLNLQDGPSSGVLLTDLELRALRPDYRADRPNPAASGRTPAPGVRVPDTGGGTLDQVVQARVEGKADVHDLLMEYCKMKSPFTGAFCYWYLYLTVTYRVTAPDVVSALTRVYVCPLTSHSSICWVDGLTLTGANI